MCILSYLPEDVDVDEDGLFNGGLVNGDGHGWAIVTDDRRRIVVGKSLDLQQALDEFVEARRHNRGPAIFHSRWATHGSVNVRNVHPFIVGRDPRTVVGHNGVLPAGAHPLLGDDRSDTRKFADQILPQQFKRLDRPASFAALEKWVGGWNKLVILTVNPRYRHNVYMVNPGAGHWDQETGIWHSNRDYEDFRKYIANKYGQGKSFTNGLERCVICDAIGIDPGDFCASCGTCQDCLETRTDCMCWTRDAMNWGRDEELYGLQSGERRSFGYEGGWTKDSDGVWIYEGHGTECPRPPLFSDAE